MKNRIQQRLMQPVTRFRYAFDKTVSRGPWVLGGWVATVSLSLVLGLAVIVALAKVDPEMNFWQVLWTMLMQALAPNPVEWTIGPVGFLLVMLLITLIGIFMVSIFIGIITTGIEDKVQGLRKGRTPIVEREHTVILGWDEHIFTILSELSIANENHKKTCVAILGEMDKVEMEAEIRAKVKHNGHTEIVCRSGSPLEMSNLELVSIATAKSIIILAPEGPDADIYVTKALLAVAHRLQHSLHAYQIVTEIHDEMNLDAATLAGKGRAVILQISDIIAHIIAQTCRQSGLSIVYTELLNFSGDEIYFKMEPGLVGKTFGESLFLYEDTAVIGLRLENGAILLNPPMDTRIGAQDEIIAISEDDNTVRLTGMKAAPRLEQISQCAPAPRPPETTLVLGWNQRGPTILEEIDQYAAPGSTATVVAVEIDPAAEQAALQPCLKNQKVTFRSDNFTDRRTLNDLHVERYRHVIVLSEKDGLDAQASDARTIITLLHLRDINERAGQPFSIVSEMRDVRNRTLAEITRADDFIVSDELASLLMAQISENRELYQVFENLFYPEGSEIYLKPAGEYVRLGEPVNFYTVVEAARRRNQVALGYRINRLADSEGEEFGVVINPDKSREVTFHEEDRVVVLAEG